MELPDIFTWQIIKWVLIVLVAGFIGQFGRSFAQYVLNRIRWKKAVTPAPLSSATEVQNPLSDARTRGSVQDKKVAKTLLKAGKKESKRREI
jgi:hypothetical protein